MRFKYASTSARVVRQQRSQNPALGEIRPPDECRSGPQSTRRAEIWPEPSPPGRRAYAPWRLHRATPGRQELAKPAIAQPPRRLFNGFAVHSPLRPPHRPAPHETAAPAPPPARGKLQVAVGLRAAQPMVQMRHMQHQAQLAGRWHAAPAAGPPNPRRRKAPPPAASPA